jgi:hypothetical protein
VAAVIPARRGASGEAEGGDDYSIADQDVIDQLPPAAGRAGDAGV